MAWSKIIKEISNRVAAAGPESHRLVNIEGRSGLPVRQEIVQCLRMTLGAGPEAGGNTTKKGGS